MKKFAFTILSIFLLTNASIGQVKTSDIKDQKANTSTGEMKEGWTKGGSVGLNFDQLMLVNPYVGEGANKLALGGLIGWTADFKKGRLLWKTKLTEDLGIQKIGRGVNNPIQKAKDQLNVTSKVNFQTAEGSKWFYSLFGGLRSQLLPTYAPNTLMYIEDTSKSPSLNKIEKNKSFQSGFMSPGFVTIAPGASFIKDSHFDMFVSPAFTKIIIVNDDRIASRPGIASEQRGLFGTKWRSATDFEKIEIQVGACLIATYKNKFLGDKIDFYTDLTLSNNYLYQPTNIDVEWNTMTKLNIIKGFGISLITQLTYDHDILVAINDADNNLFTGTNGNEQLGRRVRFTQGLLLTYGFTF